MKNSEKFTETAASAIGRARDAAAALGHAYVGTEHILLGLLREGEGVAARVLRNLNVDLEKSRVEIMKDLDPNYEPENDPNIAAGAGFSNTPSRII